MQEIVTRMGQLRIDDQLFVDMVHEFGSIPGT